jgi:hypothetical protein
LLSIFIDSFLVKFVPKDYEYAGDVVLRRKLGSHADICEKFYPHLFPIIYPDGRPEKKKTGKKNYQA